MISTGRTPRLKEDAQLIEARAQLMGIRGAALDDAVADVSPHVLRFRYDAIRSNGATPQTVLTAVIDRQLLAIRRRERRYQRCLERARAELVQYGETTYEEPTELHLDVATALKSLSDKERRVSELLGEGASVAEIATTLGCDWHTVHRCIVEIRSQFAALGMDEWLQTG